VIGKGKNRCDSEEIVSAYTNVYDKRHRVTTNHVLVELSFLLKLLKKCLKVSRAELIKRNDRSLIPNQGKPPLEIGRVFYRTAVACRDTFSPL